MTDAETTERNYAFTIKYTYNGLGQKSKETYQGAAYSYLYDGIGNLLRTEIDGVMKSSSSYDLAGREISFIDALGNTTNKRWNNFDKLSKSINQGDATIDSLQTIYQYDKLGNLVNTKDSMGALNTYTYDSFGRNLSYTAKNESDLMISSYISYDLNGNILSKTDGNGNTTESTYDALNRNIDITNALNQKTTYTYDENGNLISQEDYLGNVTKNVYDGINRLVETRDAYNHVIKQLEYNDADVQIASYDAMNNKTEFLYDKNLRQTGTKDAEGNTSGVVYDLRGNISEKKDANGNIILYQYDVDNHLTKVTDALGNSTSYTYDTAGNLLTQTDGNGNTTTYHYNSANLVTSKTDPAGFLESYNYYPNGKMNEKIDRNGTVTFYTYDIFGRLLIEDAGGQIQSYTYDANGNMLTMADQTGTTTRTYDALNRNISKDVPAIGKSIYEYDLAATSEGEYFERTTDPKGNITLKTYDKVGRLSKVTADGRTTQYEYYNNGNRSSVRYPDGTTETYIYDKDNRITSLVNTKVDDSVISTYQYTYDAAGNRRSEKVEYGLISSATVYSYDECERLTATMSSDGTEIRYLYDRNGNLASKSVGKMETVSADELSEEKLPEFDLIINKGDTDGTGAETLAIYNYDNYNRLTKLKSGNSTTVYGYNAQGYRVEKKMNSKTTRYLYEYDKVVLETDDSNNQTAYQVYGTNLLYRSVTGEAGSGAQNYYHLYNAHGDVTSLLDLSGGIAVSYDYDAFGNIKNQTGIADNQIRYGGYQYDEESGLYYLNARYYDSVTARFISEDTYTGQRNDPLSLNLYTYCLNNPISYTDPSGHRVAVQDYSDVTSSVKSKTSNSSKTSSSSKTNKTSSSKTATKSTSTPKSTPKVTPKPTPAPAVAPKKSTTNAGSGKESKTSIPKKEKDYSQASVGSIALPSAVIAVETGISGKITLPESAAVAGVIKNAFAVNPYVAATVVLTGVITYFWPAETVNQGEKEWIEEKHKAERGAEGAGKTNGGSKTGAKPENKSPEGSGRKGAFNKAKENNGIPRSEQPEETTPNYDKRGNSQPGRQYKFKNGTTIRDDSAGHEYQDDPSQNIGPHFNDPAGNHYMY